jgi:hypothetical protein
LRLGTATQGEGPTAPTPTHDVRTPAYNQASRAVLNLAARDGAGSNGPIGTGDLMLDSRGWREWGTHTGQASWAQLLAVSTGERVAGLLFVLRRRSVPSRSDRR